MKKDHVYKLVMEDQKRGLCYLRTVFPGQGVALSFRVWWTPEQDKDGYSIDWTAYVRSPTGICIDWFGAGPTAKEAVEDLLTNVHARDACAQDLIHRGDNVKDRLPGG